MDILRLIGVECRCRVGVPEWERREPQRMLIDLAVEVDLAKAGRTDDLADGPDYQELEGQVRAAAESGEFRLVERLAHVVAEVVLRFDERVGGVTVAVRKNPVVMPNTREVVVEIRRARPSDQPS